MTPSSRPSQVSVGDLLKGLGTMLLTAFLWGAGFFQDVPGSLRVLLALAGALSLMKGADFIVTCRAGWIIGWMAGFVFYIIVFYWLPYPLHRFAVSPLSAWRAWLVLVLLALYMGLYWGLWLAGVTHVRRCLGRDSLGLWFGSLYWIGLAHIRSHLFTGLPWGQVEVLLSDWPSIVQWADLMGSPAIGGWLLLLGGYGVRFLHRWDLKGGIGLMLLVVLPYTYGLWSFWQYSKASNDLITFRMIQPSITQDIKLSADPMVWFQIQIGMSRFPRPATRDLVVWPEFSIPLRMWEPRFQVLIRTLQAWNQAYLLAGGSRMVSSFPKTIIYNSGFLIDPAGHIVDFHDKVRPVPLGEYIPLSDVPWLQRVLTFLVGFREALTGEVTPAPSLRPVRSPWGPLGVLICSESIFPHLSRRLTQQGARVLVVLSNNAWLGRTSGAFQHFLHTRFRAIETRRPVLMVSNSGLSALVEPTGHVRWRTRIFERVVKDDQIGLIDRPVTVWVRWGRAIEFFWNAWGLLGIGVILWPRRAGERSSFGSPTR